MTLELTHEQASDEIEAVALGIATEEVAATVNAHAAGCAECAAELQSFYGVVTALAGLIPARQLNRGHSAGIKSRLLAKAVAGQEGGASRRVPRAETARPPEPRSLVAKPVRIDESPAVARESGSNAPLWIAAVATLIAIGSLAAYLGSRGGDNGSLSSAEALPGSESRVAELERMVAEKDSTILSLSGPGVRIISLYNREAREALGRMFWDRRNDQWTLFIYSLRQPRAGRTFQVRVGTNSRRVSLGTFQPASNGTVTFRTARAIPMAEMNNVWISEEAAGADPNGPMGSVVLAGALR